MKKYRVATASYASFSNVALAQKYLQRCRYPVVIKADGLAAGKGVEICNDLVTASAIIQRFMVESIFKQAGMKIVIEEFLEGIEASIICVVDNNTIVPLITAQDHKTIFENNQGPNTGGMGVIAPNTHVSKETMEDFTNNIMQKTFVGLKSEKFNFHGFLFFGVMVTKDGCKLLEYNVRMGDPECQSIIPLMDFDLADMFANALQNKLNKFLFN
jgi:phosphoribosylamine--glycine ligase